MKKIVVPLSLLALCITNAYAQEPNLNLAAKVLDTISFINHNQAKTWPGFHLNRTPLVVHFSDDQGVHVYAFGLKPVNPSWKPLTVNNKTVYYMEKDEYNLNSIAWGFEKIDGQRTFVHISYPNEDTFKNVLDITYSRFYNYQHYTNESDFLHVDPDNYPFYKGMRDLDQVNLGYLELQALKAYLSTTDSAQKENIIKDAVAINQYRNSILDAPSHLLEPFMSKQHDFLIM